jgi:hypothetical protein
LEFDEIWLVSSLLDLIARKNKFPAKGDQKFEIPFKMGFGLIIDSLNPILPFYVPLLNLGLY